MNMNLTLPFLAGIILSTSAFAESSPTASPAASATTAPDAPELTKLLKDFLAGASRNDAAMHDRFWADDLIYTGSSGRRIGKADLMKNVREEGAPKPNEPATVYTAEDIRIQQYGETAIVAFRLVGTTTKGGATEVKNYLNSGTFLKRKAEWRVVNWQATVLPKPEENGNSSAHEDAKTVAALDTQYQAAVKANDPATMDKILADDFILVTGRGRVSTKADLLKEARNKSTVFEKQDEEEGSQKVRVWGDTAVVTALLWIKGNSDGQAFDRKLWFSDTYVRTPAGWRYVFGQASLALPDTDAK